MARLRRRWRLIKWSGVLLLILMPVAWVVSGRYNGGLGPVFLGRGSLIITDVPSSEWWSPYFYRMRQWSEFDWMPELIRARPASYLILPLWIETLLLAILTFLLWRRDRRIPPHCCQKCGYNLTGNVTGVCPECGSRRA